jgi:hypothetical protein
VIHEDIDRAGQPPDKNGGENEGPKHRHHRGEPSPREKAGVTSKGTASTNMSTLGNKQKFLGFVIFYLPRLPFRISLSSLAITVMAPFSFPYIIITP